LKVRRIRLKLLYALLSITSKCAVQDRFDVTVIPKSL